MRSIASHRGRLGATLTLEFIPWDVHDVGPECGGRYASYRTSGFALEYDAARKIAQGLGAHLEQLASLIEVKGETAQRGLPGLPNCPPSEAGAARARGGPDGPPAKPCDDKVVIVILVEAVDPTASATGARAAQSECRSSSQ